jgi:hypothetical protein
MPRDVEVALFELLCAAILFSARIGAKQGVKAARAMFDQGWTTAEKLAASTWEERVRVLNQHGYARSPAATTRRIAISAEVSTITAAARARRRAARRARRSGRAP